MTLAIIQARVGSTRLPGKALMDIGGKPMTRHVVERVQRAGVDRVVVAVGGRDRTAFQALPCPVLSFPSILDDDVLSRFVAVAERYPSADTIMRVTGDCPLWNPDEAREVLKLYRSTPGAQFATNVVPGAYVDGEDVEVFSRGALMKAHLSAVDPHDREHVTPWMRRHLSSCCRIASRSGPKTSVDTLEELERVRQMVQSS